MTTTYKSLTFHHIGHPCNSIRIHDSVALRLKEFSYVTGHNPEQMANMILVQWMDQQMQMYHDFWDISGEKERIMSGRAIPGNNLRES